MAEELKHPVHSSGERQAGETQPALDAASASLANALRTSFRILTLVILLLIVLFLSRGFFTVQSDQKAIILRFGYTDTGLVMDQGLHYALPYPIDEVIPVWVKQKTIEVNTFWTKVTEETRQDAAEKGKEKAEDVKGAEDAFMLTGDLNILQARWVVTYYVGRESESVLRYYVNVGTEENEEKLVRNALQSAVVREIGRLKVTDAYPPGQKVFPERVKATFERTLRDLDCGLVVERVNLYDIRPPKQVKPAFDNVLAAQQTAGREKLEAEREAQKTLIDAAGEVGIQLGAKISQWWAAREANRPEEMKTIELEVRELFKKAGGQSRTLIAEARAYKVSVTESAKGDAAQLASLLQNPPRDVKTYLDHARVSALQEVLSGCYEKFVYQPPQDATKGTMYLQINRRPELLREMKKVQQTR